MGNRHEIIRGFPTGYRLHATLAERDGEQVVVIQWKREGKGKKAKPCDQELHIPTDIAEGIFVMLGQFAASVASVKQDNEIPF